MELTENLKKKLTDAQTKDEAKDTTKDARKDGGMLLEDEDLAYVSGGGGFYAYDLFKLKR